MRQKRIGVRVLPPPRRRPHKPKPDCPNCKQGILTLKEYVEVATAETDEIRTMVLYCLKCEWVS